MKHNDGGPAFPHDYVDCPGMTLWQHYYGLAMQGYEDMPMKITGELPQMAKWCADYADAMIAEMRKREARGPDSADDNPPVKSNGDRNA